MTTLSFSRKRNTNDPKDWAFTNDQCLYMMFPVKGGAFNSVNKKIRKHEVVPVVSAERICIRSCGNGTQLFFLCAIQCNIKSFQMKCTSTRPLQSRPVWVIW